VLLHGAGSTAQHGIAPLLDHAEDAGLALLAPTSHGRTWDVLLGGFGPDVAGIDALLGHLFERLEVDPERLAVGGFSDGASYALSLGITNGDLFRHVLAFSPGFAAPGRRQGQPAIFVSHGVRDPVLPIDRCSRRVVPALRAGGYDVDYREFDGGHELPPPLARDAVAWMLAGRAAGGQPAGRRESAT